MPVGMTVNPNLVREIIKTKLTDDDIEGEISSALVLYNFNLGSSSIPNDLQLEIKRYIAAHFVSLRDQTTRIDSEDLGDAKTTYSKVGQDPSYFGLMSTRWGQAAIVFDPTGILRTLGHAPPAMYAITDLGAI